MATTPLPAHLVGITDDALIMLGFLLDTPGSQFPAFLPGATADTPDQESILLPRKLLRDAVTEIFALRLAVDQASRETQAAETAAATLTHQVNVIRQTCMELQVERARLDALREHLERELAARHTEAEAQAQQQTDHAAVYQTTRTQLEELRARHEVLQASHQRLEDAQGQLYQALLEERARSEQLETQVGTEQRNVRLACDLIPRAWHEARLRSNGDGPIAEAVGEECWKSSAVAAALHTLKERVFHEPPPA
jgi:hypothetical protein